MRIKVADKYGTEDNIKPYLPNMTGNEKDKMMAQYYAAKRTMNP